MPPSGSVLYSDGAMSVPRQLHLGLVACLVTVTLAGCTSSMSQTEYANSVETLANDYTNQFEAIDARMESGTPSLGDARAAVTEGAAIRANFQQDLEELDPPEELAGIHAELLDIHGRITAAHVGWAASGETATSIEDFASNPEAEAYRTIGDAEGVGICRKLQTTFDATSERADLADVAWMPAEAKEAINVSFGCS